ncbi:hypothetical protein [Nitrosomonas aestuarii]|uniref:Uncharacterized protein n=1 Tax=Nitrosomonas aestuarii TaxID=52441 RepID=A0A1I4A885_9PROT|nr:hypothetical protein [Nitrosomonas aestuarii]PTN11269.1 hypothetical protein C8R11_11149 [Nitrosomonas aestuarii]SFK52297.1 hypothetical protein SAMN05216302_100862 [Nitrosomonas aestuarii]
MEAYTEQISKYFETVPLWPFFLLGFVVLVAIAIEAVNRKRRQEAIEGFRQTIETELASMYPKHIRWPENINQYLCSRLPEMQYNFEVLRGFIPQDRLLSYNTAWKNYCDFCRNITDEKCAASEQPANERSDAAQLSSNNASDPKSEFHKLISDLLAFTNM